MSRRVEEPRPTPVRDALILRAREAIEHPELPPFDKRVLAAAMQLRAARAAVRERHGEIVAREAEAEVFGR